MRFSSRSKMSILFSLLALAVLVGGFAIYGLTGKHGAAHAAPAPSPKVSSEHLISKGTTTFKPTKVVTGNGDTSLEINNDPESNLPKDTQSQPSGAGAPNTGSLPVTTSNSNFSGFPGINHAAQRYVNNGNQFSLEPPDQGMCAGNGYVLEGVNLALAVYTESGHIITTPPTAINSFFGLPPSIIRSTPPVYGPFTSDPKCYYDQATQRWFLTVLEIDRNASTGAYGPNSSVLIAVSQTNNPNGAWYTYALTTTDATHPGCPCFGDQPLIGADKNGFYITTNEFNLPGQASAFNGAQMYAISKSQLEAGGAVNSTHLDASQMLTPYGGLSYSVQPATSPSGNGSSANMGTEFFLSALDFNGTTDTRVAAWALTNTASLNTTPAVNLNVTVIGSEAYGQPPAATQKNGPRPLGKALGAPLEQLNSNDDRMNQVVYSQGLLWSGVNTVLKSANNNLRVGIAYFLVQPGFSQGQLTASMAKQGYVSVAGNNVMFPSIGVTGAGKGVMSFTLVGPNYYPSAAYAPIDALNGVGGVHIAGAGALPEDGFTGYAAYGGNGVARWGDYSAAVADGNTVWLAAEYIPNLPRTSLANWGTFISSVKP